MRKHGIYNAPFKPPCQTGPSKHGKCIVATHLAIMKQRVRDHERRKRRIRV